MPLQQHGRALEGEREGDADAAAEPDVSVVATFPADSHPAIVYPAAAVAGSDNALNGPFLDYLASAKAAEVFGRMGFEVLE